MVPGRHDGRRGADLRHSALVPSRRPELRGGDLRRWAGRALADESAARDDLAPASDECVHAAGDDGPRWWPGRAHPSGTLNPIPMIAASSHSSPSFELWGLDLWGLELRDGEL